ncbi:hypothetical protein FNV43_RR13694 [Rhamnella rubrinervis]|uniref:Large ribosomal subunit protein uL1c n=1 Tax=Rhamnella rubrinervis TaxID=2594499 RepID=A0A8K0MEN6_9ROSA|nr:hypothetical protein FNV43_RR13694 [Rhamnella rubrinervis]
MVSMAALKLLVSGARRHCLARPHSHHHASPFLGFYRSLCSSSSSPSESDPIPPTTTESPRGPSGTVPIQPVSYAPKPKDQSSPDQDPAKESPTTPSPQQPRRPHESLRPSYEARPTWTREDIRYVKDAPSISPVSYASRVAPLPEDKAPAGGDSAAGEGEGVRESEALEKETKQIDAEIRMRRRVFKVIEEDKMAAPFPTLIKVEKKERKPILDLTEAVRQVKASAKSNFDETVEAHVRLGINPKKTGQGVRGNMTLPHGTGKVVRVAFFAEGAHADEARAAGADIVGGVELVEEIASSKKLNVDKCFATNEMILRMGKISRILRERGLWPDRKLGTVTNDVAEALKKVSQGHIEFKMDKTANVHVGLGKVSYGEDNLRENIGAFVNALLLAKPAGLKKASKYAGYISSFHICSTMGPGFSVSVQSLSKAADHYNKVYLK